MRANNWPVTFSFGVAVFSDLTYSIEDMVAKADNLMFSAKNDGRNVARYATF